MASGCSFTAGGDPKSPRVWADYLIDDVNMYANLALPGGGNFAVAKNIMMFLARYQHYRSENTLVVFNISDMARVDVMCDPGDTDANDSFPWATALGINWKTHGCRPVKGIKDFGIPPAEWTNELALMGMISYLESRGFDYYFMYMLEHTSNNLSPWFRKFMDDRSRHHVVLDGHNGMMEYCHDKKLVTAEDNWHPSPEGHRRIGNIVRQHIKRTRKS